MELTGKLKTSVRCIGIGVIILASGFKPSSFTFPLISNNAEVPSFRLLALVAVIVPSFWKDGFSAGASAEINFL